MVIDPLLETLRDITGFLRNQQLEFALIGGLACMVRGEPRSTLDVDLLVGCDVPRCLALPRPGRFRGGLGLDEDSRRASA